MPDSKIKHQILKQILDSREFANSEFDKTFLEYLFNKSLSGDIPKETTIAIDLFNKGIDFNPSHDSIVRTHIYTLRKKLDTYYLTEGKCDKIRLVIPKGRYETLFENLDMSIPSSPKKNFLSKYTAILWFIISAFALIIAFYFWQKQHRLTQMIHQNIGIPADHSIWADFAHSKKPIMIVLGDYFAFMEKRKYTAGDRRIRDGAINSEADLQKFLEQYPAEQDNIANERSHYIEPSITRCLLTVLPYLKLYNKQGVFFQNGYWLNEDDLKTYDIIFFGPFKTLYRLNVEMKKLNYQFCFYPHRIYRVSDSQNDYKRLIFSAEDENFTFQQDYALIAKFMSSHQNQIMIIAAFAPNGIIQATHYMLNPDNLLKNKEHTFPRYFEAILRVNQVGNNNLIEVIDFQKLVNSKMDSLLNE